MRYVMFVCGDGTEPDVDLQAETEAWVAEMDGRGIRKTGDRLRPVADSTTVRVRGGEALVTDGPFAEGTEVIGGYSILNVDTYQEAREMARQVIQIHRDFWPGWEGSSELRQISDGPPQMLEETT